MQIQRSKQAGFSLVELLIAVLILAVGLLGLAELQVTAMRGNSKSGSVTAATSVAQTAIEEVMAVSNDGEALYTQVLKTAQPTFADWPNNPVRSLDGSGRYRISYTSQLDVGGAGSEITKVTIRVTSVDKIALGGTSVTLETLKDLRKVIKL